MLEHQSPNNVNMTEVSCTTTTLVKFHSTGLKKRSNNHFMKKSPNGTSPNGSHCALTNGGPPTPSFRTLGSDGRPPFVTTVCRGKFLPSKFDLMVERSLFTFSSRPRPIGLVTRHQCSLSSGPLKEHNSTYIVHIIPYQLLSYCKLQIQSFPHFYSYWTKAWGIWNPWNYVLTTCR